jgi:hypothetical protein
MSADMLAKAGLQPGCDTLLEPSLLLLLLPLLLCLPSGLDVC